MSAAAVTVFARYGVRKATMAEIAAEAGVSKPTLYAVFASKDHALGGAILLAKGEAIERARRECAKVSELAEKISLFFQRAILDIYDLAHSAPDADAMEDALGEASEQAIARVEQMSADALAEILAPSIGPLKDRGFEPDRLAGFAIASAINLKRHAKSREELTDHLTTLKTLIVSITRSGSPTAD